MHLNALAAHSDAPASMKSRTIMSEPPRLYSAAFVAQTSSTQGSPLILAPLLIFSSAAAESQVKMGESSECASWFDDVEYMGNTQDTRALDPRARRRNIRVMRNAAAPAAEAAASNFRDGRSIYVEKGLEE
jgi:hypothetical protein